MHPVIAEKERQRALRRNALLAWKELAVSDRKRGIRTWWPEDAFVYVPKVGALHHHEIVRAYCEAYNAG